MNTFDNEKLKQIRKTSGDTQKEFASKIGVARTTYADYEKGRIQPSLKVIQTICEKFGIEMFDLMKVPSITSNVVICTDGMTKEQEFIAVSNANKKASAYNNLKSIVDSLDKDNIDMADINMLTGVIKYLMNKYEPTKEEWHIAESAHIDSGHVYVQSEMTFGDAKHD